MVLTNVTKYLSDFEHGVIVARRCGPCSRSRSTLRLFAPFTVLSLQSMMRSAKNHAFNLGFLGENTSVSEWGHRIINSFKPTGKQTSPGQLNAVVCREDIKTKNWSPTWELESNEDKMSQSVEFHVSVMTQSGEFCRNKINPFHTKEAFLALQSTPYCNDYFINWSVKKK